MPEVAEKKIPYITNVRANAIFALELFVTKAIVYMRPDPLLSANFCRWYKRNPYAMLANEAANTA